MQFVYYANFAKQLLERFVGIGSIENKPFDFDIGQHLGTENTWSVGTVNGTLLEANAMQGGLDDNILFGVNSTADFMSSS